MHTLQPTLLYVAAAAGDESGIHTLAFDSDHARLKRIAFSPLPGAGYLAFSPDRTRLYAAASEKSRHPEDGEVAAFSVATDGSITPINSQPAGGPSCCHLTLAGNRLYCANYGNATVGEFRVAADGSLGSRTKLIRHEGQSAHPTRQSAAHTHFVGETPDKRYLAVVDLGCDGIFFYPLDPESGIPPKPAAFSRSAPGEGPRHLVFNAEGTMAYVANELGNSVSVHDYVNGTLTHRQTCSTLPHGVASDNTVAAIRLAPGGKRLLVSNRGHDSIALFDLKPDGTLEPSGFLPTEGQGPRDFIFSDDGRWMFVANERTGNVVAFAAPESDQTADRPLVSFPVSDRPIGVLHHTPAAATGT